MATSALINHCGGRDVSREELDSFEAPPATDTWFPLAHREVLGTVSETLIGAGFQITASRFSVSHGQDRFFGILDLASSISDASGGVTLAVGIRNSVDKSFPIGFCCGHRVFVCDNLSFTAEVVVSKKHTRFGRDRFLEGISRAVTGLTQYQQAARSWIDRLQQWELSEEMANSRILQSYERGVIGTRLLPLVIDEWRQPTFEDYRARTGWSLWNCFTAVLGRTRQAAHPAQAAASTIRLQELLTPPLEPDAHSERSSSVAGELVFAN
jgi:hypothetical protein